MTFENEKSVIVSACQSKEHLSWTFDILFYNQIYWAVCEEVGEVVDDGGYECGGDAGGKDDWLWE